MKKSWTLLALPLFALVSCGGPAGGGPPVLPAPGAAPQIFAHYDADRDATMADGWTRGMDMSGVSFNDTRTATLITPRHVVMAKHYTRPPGAPVVFHDRGGNRIERKIIGFAPASGDVIVGLLDQAVPAGYRAYPLPSTATAPSSLINRPVIVSDQKRDLFIHLIAGIKGGLIALKYDKAERHGWGKKLIVGDSGNPSFLISGKQLVLVETHSTGGPGAGPYYGDPGVQASVRAAVAELDPSYHIRTVKIR